MARGSLRICEAWYTPELFAAHPNARFVFGDNAERWGRGGQAAVCRDHPQAIGVATLWSPGEFFSDTSLAKKVVQDDLAKVRAALDAGHDVYWPSAGIGTGLARLKERAPELFAFIEAERDRLLSGYSAA